MSADQGAPMVQRIAGAEAVMRVMRECQVPEAVATQLIVDAQARRDLDHLGVGLGTMDRPRFEAWLSKLVGAKKSKSKGGRPTKHDWQGVLIELGYIWSTESPSKLTESYLVKRAQDWFDDQSPDGGPDKRDIQAQVRRFMARMARET